MKTIDIVVPSYNEEESLPLFYDAIEALALTMPGYEIRYIFVDDGSSDGTLRVIKGLAEKNERVGYVSFSRNFGKEAGIYAGLQNSSADIVVLMDADLQHPPALIPEMIKALDEGHGAAGAKRKVTGASKLFTKFNNKVSKTKLQNGATDFMCMSRSFVDAVLSMSEKQRFTKGIFAWVGFDVKWFDYEQEERLAGTTKWNFRKLSNYAVEGITSFSTVPLRFVFFLGAAVCLFAVIYIIITLIQTLICGIDVPGYVTTLIAILFMGGVIMLALGIIGEYIRGIYIESKNRPIYLAKEIKVKK